MSEFEANVVIPLLHECREQRLAIDALVCIAAGDDVDAAIERLESIVAAVPVEGSKGAERLGRRVELLAADVARDLRQIRGL